MRPLGNGICHLSPLLKGSNPENNIFTKECVVPIFVPFQETDWSQYQELTHLEGHSSGLFKPTLHSVGISLCAFRGDLMSVLNDYNTMLQHVPLSRRFGAVNEDEKGTGNHLHLVFKSADLTSFKRTPQIRDVQVKIRVRKATGEFVACIQDGSSNSDASQDVKTVIFANNENSIWDLFFRVDLSPQDMLNAHLYITFASNSKKDSQDMTPFAFAYLPLFHSQNEPVQDGNHKLSLYKYDDRISTPSVYMTLPAGPSIFVPAALASLSVKELKLAAEIMATQNPRLKDTLEISSRLDSRFLTQSQALMNLLHWKSSLKHHRGNIISIMNECNLIDEIETIKFYPQIISSLFEILESEIPNVESVMIAEGVMNCFVTVLSVVLDKRFSEQIPHLDETCASLALSEKGSHRMFSILERLLKNPMDHAEAKKLRGAIKVWKYLFRFILSPYAASESQLDKGRMLVFDFLKCVSFLMQNHNSDITMASQVIMLQHMHVLLEEWRPIFAPTELVDIASDFMKNIKSANPKIMTYRYTFMRHVINGFLLRDPASTSATINLVITWIQSSLSGKWGKSPALEELEVRRSQSLKGLVFATLQKRQELGAAVDFLIEFLIALHSLSSTIDLSEMTKLLPLLLDSFVHYSDWRKMRNSGSSHSRSGPAPRSVQSDASGMMLVECLRLMH